MTLPIHTRDQLVSTAPKVKPSGSGVKQKKVSVIRQKFAITCSRLRPTKQAIIGTMTKNLDTISLAKTAPIMAMLTTKLASIPSTNRPAGSFSSLPMDKVEMRWVGSIWPSFADMPIAAAKRAAPTRLKNVVTMSNHRPLAPANLIIDGAVDHIHHAAGSQFGAQDNDGKKGRGRRTEGRQELRGPLHAFRRPVPEPRQRRADD